MNQWKHKIIVITGAGSGIGEALAKHFARLDARLVLTDVNGENLTAVADRLGESVLCQRVLDVSDRQAWQSLHDQLAGSHGHIDVVINNAGLSNFDYFDQAPAEQFDRVMSVNFDGVVNGCRHMLPLLKKAERGTIVNIASIFSLITVPGLTAYHASKFAVRGFSSALQQDLAFQGLPIDVVCVMPGGIRTNIAKNSITANRNLDKYARHFDKVAKTTPSQAARIIEKGMSCRRFKVLVGPDATLLSLIERVLHNSYHGLVNRLLGVDKIMK